MTDMDLVREDAVKTVLAHYKLGGIVGSAINAGRGILNAGRSAMSAVKAMAPAAERAADAPGALRTAYNAFRGEGGLHHGANLAMGAGALYGGSRLIGSGLSAGMGNQQQQPRPMM